MTDLAERLRAIQSIVETQRAEIERLRECWVAGLRGDACARLSGEAMSYSLEIEGLVAHIHKLEAEIERLRRVNTEMLDENEQRALETGRLRAALSAIVHPDNGSLVFVASDAHAMKLRDDAVRALNCAEAEPRTPSYKP